MSCSSRISRILSDGPPLVWELPLDSPPVFQPSPRKASFFSFIGNRKREKESKESKVSIETSKFKIRSHGTFTNLSLQSTSSSKHAHLKGRISPPLIIETAPPLEDKPVEDKPLPDLPPHESFEAELERERQSRRQFSPLPPLVEEPEQERPSTGRLSPPSASDSDDQRCRSCPPEYTPRSEVSPLSALTNLISSRDRGQSPISSESYSARLHDPRASPPSLISPTWTGQHQSWPGREGDIDWIAYFRSRPLPSTTY